MAPGFMSAAPAAEARNAVLHPEARLIPNEPVFTGVTPTPAAPAEDLREIGLTIPATLPEQRWLLWYRLRGFDTPQLLPAGAFLEYDVFIPADSLAANGGLDLESRPRSHFMLRGDPPVYDQNGIGSHPGHDLGSRARNQWYSRRFDLARVAGKPFQDVYLAAEFSAKGTGEYRARYRRLRIVDAAGRVYWNFFPPPGEFFDPADSGLPAGTVVTATDGIMVGIRPSRYCYGFAAALNLDVCLRNLDPARPQSATVRVRVQDVDNHEMVRDLGAFTMDAGPSTEATHVLPLEPPLGPRHYRAVADVTLAGATGSRRSATFSAIGEPRPLPTARDVGRQRAFLWGADVIGFPGLETLAGLRTQGGNFANVFVPWGKVETRPGEYDFSLLERMIADAARANLRVELFFITADSDYPAWYRQENMVDQDGNVFQSGIALSYWAPTARPAFLRLVEATTRRYRGNPTVLGYQFTFGGWGDGFHYGPKDGSLRLYDYSEFSQARFREYVQTELKLSLAQAAARYGLPLAAWTDLKQPLPQEGIDVRPWWWDFQNYRCWSVAKMWDDVCRTVRGIDRHCLLELDYGGSQEATGTIANDYDAGARIARRYRASIHNTCYEGASAAPLLGTYSRQFGILHTFETAGTPAAFPAHQQAMFNLLRFGPAGYCWIGGQRLDGIYATYGELRPVAADLLGTTPVGKRLGLVQSVSFYQSCQRPPGQKYAGLAGAAFAAAQGLPPALFTDRYFLDRAAPPLPSPAEMPVLLAYGEPVLTAEAMDAMLTYARSGGTLVLFPQSGRYTAGRPDDAYRLLVKAGFADSATLPAPASTLVATGEGVLTGHAVRLGAATSLAAVAGGAEILARFPDGQAAMLCRPCGKGRAILMGGAPDMAHAESAETMLVLLREFGIVPVAQATGGIETAVLERGHSRFLVLHNPASRPVATNVRCGLRTPGCQVYDLVTATALKIGAGEAAAAGAVSVPVPVPGAIDVRIVADKTEPRAELAMTLTPHEVKAFAFDGPRESPRLFQVPDYPRPEAPPPVPAAADPARLRPLEHWRVAGPFANPDGFKGASFATARPPEADWSPTAVYRENGAERRWETVTAPDGVLRFTERFPFAPQTLAYAVTEIVAPREMRARLSLGVDYAAFLWLNGQPLFDSNALTHGPGPDEIVLDVPLHAGANQLAAKVAPGSAGWALFVKMTDPGQEERTTR